MTVVLLLSGRLGSLAYDALPVVGAILPYACRPSAVSTAPPSSSSLSPPPSVASVAPRPPAVFGPDTVVKLAQLATLVAAVRAAQAALGGPASGPIVLVLGPVTGLVETRLRLALGDALWVRLAELVPKAKLCSSLTVARGHSMPSPGQPPPPSTAELAADFRDALQRLAPAQWARQLVQGRPDLVAAVEKLMEELPTSSIRLDPASASASGLGRLPTRCPPLPHFLLCSFAQAVYHATGLRRTAICPSPCPIRSRAGTPPPLLLLTVDVAAPESGTALLPLAVVPRMLSPGAPHLILAAVQLMRAAVQQRGPPPTAAAGAGGVAAEAPLSVIPWSALHGGTAPAAAAAAHRPESSVALTAWLSSNDDISRLVERVPVPPSPPPVAAAAPGPGAGPGAAGSHGNMPPLPAAARQAASVMAECVPSSVSTVDVTVLVLALFHEGLKLKLTAGRLYPTPDKLFARNAMGNILEVPGAAGGRVQWVPPEVDHLAETTAQFDRPSDAMTWAVTTFAPRLLALATASSHRQGQPAAAAARSHKAVLVLTGETDTYLQLLTAMVSGCALVQPNEAPSTTTTTPTTTPIGVGHRLVLRPEFNTNSFTLGWAHDRTFWPACTSRGYAHQLVTAWQHQHLQVQQLHPLTLLTQVSAFVPDCPIATSFAASSPAEAAATYVDKASYLRQQLLAYATTHIWNPTAMAVEELARDVALQQFAVCVAPTNTPAAATSSSSKQQQQRQLQANAPPLFGSASPLLKFYKGVVEVDASPDLLVGPTGQLRTKLLVVQDGASFLRRLWRRPVVPSGNTTSTSETTARSIAAFFDAGGQLWCLSYAHHLLTGFGGEAAPARPSLQAMASVYALPAEVAQCQGGELDLLLLLFRKQTLVAAKHTGQMRILTARMPTVLATVRMEQAGLAVAPKAARQALLEAKKCERDDAAAVLVGLLPPHMQASAATGKWSPRSIQDLALLLFGGLPLRLLSRIVPSDTGNSPGRRPDNVSPALLAALRGATTPGDQCVTHHHHQRIFVVVLTVPIRRAHVVTHLSVYFAGGVFAALKPFVHLTIQDEGPRTGNTHTLRSAIDTIASHPCAVKLRQCLQRHGAAEETAAVASVAGGGDPTRSRAIASGPVDPPHEVVFVLDSARAPQSFLTLSPLVHALLTGVRCDASGTTLDGNEGQPPVLCGITFVNGKALTVNNAGSSFADDFAELEVRGGANADESKTFWQQIVSDGAGKQNQAGKNQQQVRKPRDGLATDEQQTFLNALVPFAALDAAAADPVKDPFSTRMAYDPLPSMAQRMVVACDAIPQLGGELPGLLQCLPPTDQAAVFAQAWKKGALSIDAAFFTFFEGFVKARLGGLARHPDEATLLTAIAAVLQARGSEKISTTEMFAFAMGTADVQRTEAASARWFSNFGGDVIRTEFDIYTVSTGRLSSSKPTILNIPLDKDFRACFVSRFGPTDGLLVELDYSQLEVAILAVLAEDQSMLDAIRRQMDFHAMRVSLMTKEPYSDVVARIRARDPVYLDLRQKAKVFSFQRQYGAGVATIAEHSGLPVADIHALIRKEEAQFAGVTQYVQLVGYALERFRPLSVRMRAQNPRAAAADVGIVADARVAAPLATLPPGVAARLEPASYFQLPTGTKFGFKPGEAYGPHIRNYPVQGFAAEVVQIVVGQIDRLLQTMHRQEQQAQQQRDGTKQPQQQPDGIQKAVLVNTVHDSVWLDVHRSVAAEAIDAVKALMESAPAIVRKTFPTVQFDIPLPVSAKAGPTLGSMSEEGVPTKRLAAGNARSQATPQ